MKISEIWRPDDYDFIVNPFPQYEKLRKISPVFVSPTEDYVVLSYEDVKKVLGDKSCLAGVRKDWMDRAIVYSKKKNQDFSPISKVMQALLFQMNPSMHSDLRKVLLSYWPSKNWVDEISKKHAKTLLKELPDEGNFVHHVARKMPLLVINEMLGSAFTLEELMEDGMKFLRTLDPYLTARDLEGINQSAIRIHDIFSCYYEQVDIEADGFSAWVKKNESQFLAYKVDPISVILFLYLAGQDTTANLISSVLDEILRDKSLIGQLDSDQRIENFIHEVLRLHSPVQLTERVNTNEISLGGRVIPPKSILSLCIGAANRDPEVFENPNELNLDRDQNRHITFGYGIHHCMGNQIALLETFYLLKELLPVLGAYELVSEAHWDKRLAIRNITTLNVRKSGNG